MSRIKAILIYLYLALCCYLGSGDSTLKQDKAEKPFTLKCPSGHYMSMFGGDFTNNGTDRRRYRIQCHKLKVTGQSKCNAGKSSDFMKYFTDIGCGENEYLGGIDSSKFKDGDRRFRLICCQTSGLVITDTCKEVETHNRQNFTQKLSEDEVIHKLSSKFTIWQSNKQFILDRRWTMTICKWSKNSTDNESGNATKGPELNATDVEKPVIPLNEACKVGVDHDFSTSEPESNQDTIELGRNTPAFKMFNVHCPNGHAITSIRVVLKVDGTHRKRKDTAYSIKCDQLPFAEDLTTCPVKRRTAPFSQDTDIKDVSSVQSPCDRNNGEFLCGLSGFYNINRRKLTATCCTIKEVYPSPVEPEFGDPSDAGFAEVKSPSKFLINLDQLPDGSIIGHMAPFRRIYLEQGQPVSTPEGCHCRCPCKCPLEDSDKKQSQRGAASVESKNLRGHHTRTRRDNVKCSNVDCSCKCYLPCDK